MPQQHEGDRPRGDDPDERFGVVSPPPSGAGEEAPATMFVTPVATADELPRDDLPHDPPPRARRMPVWAWVVIIVAVGVAVALTVALIVGALNGAVPGSDETEAERSPAVSPHPTAPADAVPVNGTFDLDAPAPFDAGPHWESAPAAGWNVVRSGDGARELANDAGCSFVTSAGPALTDQLEAEGAASREVFDILESSYDDAEGVTDVTTSGLDPVWLIADGAGSVEFLSGRVSYRLASGEEWTTQFITRTFAATGATLYASLQCPSASLQDGAFISETLGAAEIATG